MEDFDIDGFLRKYGDLFKSYFQQELNRKRLSAPGYTGRAYASKGRSGDGWAARNKRDRTYAGMRPRSPYGSALNESVTMDYNPNTQTIGILMLDYWQVVDEGRKPGTYAPVDALKDWIRNKTNLPEEASFGINRNIWKFGIVPNGFYGRATDRIADKLEKDFGDDFSDVLELFLDSLIEPQTR